MFSFAEVRRNTTQRRATRAFNGAVKRMKDANSNFRDFARIHFAMVAHNAFSSIFQSITGMNEAQIIELPWSDDFEIQTSRMKFKAIKYRAGGKLCSFEISVKSLPIFLKFLELRRFLIADYQYDLLFLTLGINNQFMPRPMRPQAYQAFFKSLRKFDPTLPILGPRKWRAAKSDDVIATEENLQVAAELLQNSVSTMEKSYAAGSEQTHHEEMSSYFIAFSKTVVLKTEEREFSVPIANGRCKAPNSPTPLDSPPSVLVDCSNTEGCLFCDKYRIHPDREDVSKLLSARFYVDSIARCTTTAEQFDKFFEPILKRIDSIIDKVEEVAAEVVKEITASVGRGHLSEFWAQKIWMLQFIGII